MVCRRFMLERDVFCAPTTTRAGRKRIVCTLIHSVKVVLGHSHPSAVC